MTSAGQWQLIGSSAELYQRYLVPAITSLWAADLIARADPRPNDRVLDIACGTGVVTRMAAERIAGGRVVGLDLNPGMLAMARSLQPVAGAPIEWRDGSALDLPFADAAFDLVLCQLGLQFFPDQARALSEMHRVLADGGRLALNVYSAIERTPVALALSEALDQRIAPGASAIKRSEHALASPEELRQSIEEAGFRNVALDIVVHTISFPSARDYVRLQLIATPMARLIEELDEAGRSQVIDQVAADLATALGAGSPEEPITSPQEGFVVTARS